MRKILRLMLTGLLTLGFIVIAVCVQANTSVTFTENSSTELTATIGTVYNIQPNLWEWIPPAPPGMQAVSLFLLYPSNAVNVWAEPESSITNPTGNLFSGITYYTWPIMRFQISSDYPLDNIQASIIVNNNGISIASLVAVEWSDYQTYTYYDVAFFDNAAASEVPEPSLMVLLGISVMSLAGLRRWWKE